MMASTYSGSKKRNCTTHSVKVPRLYKIASKIIREVKENGGSPKGLVFQRPHPNVKALFALVQEALKHSGVLDVLFKETRFLEKECRVDPYLSVVLVTELLWGKKKLPGDSKPVKCVLKYEAAFHEHLRNINVQLHKPQLGVTEKSKENPRAVRVNTLVLSVSQATEHFISEGWIYMEQQLKNYEEFLVAVKNLEYDKFLPDFHMNDVLIFAPGTNLVESELYTNGAIFLQSKSSCMSSFLLNPKPGSVVLDMCAAPGMKTTHLAALMKDRGILYSIEINRERVNTLKEMVKKSKATCVRVTCEDALNTSSAVYPDVKYILVDPTCSGSGGYYDLDTSPEKLNRLMGFQTMMLRHALTQFPKAKRVVYSTCSIHPEENEQVVDNVLRTVVDFKVKNILSGAWKNRGSPQYLGGSRCLYAKPDEDLTTGFFIAVFQRKKSSITSAQNHSMIRDWEAQKQ